MTLNHPWENREEGAPLGSPEADAEMEFGAYCVLGINTQERKRVEAGLGRGQC